MIMRKRRVRPAYGEKRILVIDKFNSQSLQSIRTKLYRDYLGFFGNLYRIYGPSERRNEIHHIIGKINKLIITIDNVIAGGKVTSADISELLAGVDDLNESRDVFADEVENIKSLRERVEKVVKHTGIPLQDLNITRDIIRRGAVAAIKAQRPEPIGIRMRRTMPTAHKMISEITAGAKIAAFGPFTPLAEIIGSGALGLYRAARGIRERLEERRIGRHVRPSAYGAPIFGPRISRRAARRGVAGTMRRPMISPKSISEEYDPLFHFFNTRAYKARWTKELLSRTRTAEDKDSFGILSGYLPSIAKGIGIIAGWKIVEAINSLRDLGKAEKAAREAGGRLGIIRTRFEKSVAERGLSKTAEDLGISETDLIRQMAATKLSQQKVQLTGAPFETKIPIIGGLVRKAFKYPLPRVQPLPEIIKEYEQKFGYKPTTVQVGEPDKTVLGAIEILRKLSSSVDKLSDSVRKDRELPSIKTPGIINQYDSADTLINNHSTGRLTINRN